jgi:hypothetical protein
LRVESLSSDYKACYGNDIEANVFVIIANSEGQKKVDVQINAISQVELESLKLILVRGYDFKEDDSGYYLSMDDAKKLLYANSYSVFLYSEEGQLLLTSKNVVEVNKISNVLK